MTAASTILDDGMRRLVLRMLEAGLIGEIQP